MVGSMCLYKTENK